MHSIACAALLLVGSLGCKETARTGAKYQRDVLLGDTTSHVLPDEDRALVLRARAFDRSNQLDSARILYEEAARRIPGVADWLYLCAAGVAGDSADRASDYAHVKSSVARTRIGFTEAIARERAGDIAGAIRQYTATGARVSALRLRLSPGVSVADRASARVDLLHYIGNPPGNDEGRDAIALFDQLGGKRTGSEELTIARVASRAGFFARAAEGYAKAPKGSLTSNDRFRYGIALSRLNHDAQAATQFAAVKSPAFLAAPARYQQARALIAMGNVTGARALLRGITSSYPKDSSAAAALLLLSDLATDDGRDDHARATLLTLANQFRGSRQAPVARFRAAMIAFIARNYATAAQEMDSVALRPARSSESDAATYWAGKAYAALGDTARSHARWRSAIASDPLGYYGVLSAKKLGTTLISSDNTPSSYPVVPAVDSAVGRIATLKDLGMDTEAGFEYTRLFRDASGSQPRLLATAHALSGTEESERSIALGRKAIEQLGRSPANLRLYFPILERETLIQSAKENSLDPILVAALIRQESEFNPKATSGAGARGLMQLLPSVGRSVAAAKGIGPWDPALLYQPAINIRLGTAHLAGLVHEYPNVERVLAAYNAGESRVAKWATKAGANDPEIFTERIPFVETRDYVRAIVRNETYYGALYSW